jgi:hypothetical protein
MNHTAAIVAAALIVGGAISLSGQRGDAAVEQDRWIAISAPSGTALWLVDQIDRSVKLCTVTPSGSACGLMPQPLLKYWPAAKGWKTRWPR